VIRNSYDRLAVNNQVLHTVRSSNNNDLIDVVREDLAKLDRQIDFEREILR